MSGRGEGLDGGGGGLLACGEVEISPAINTANPFYEGQLHAAIARERGVAYPTPALRHEAVFSPESPGPYLPNLLRAFLTIILSNTLQWDKLAEEMHSIRLSDLYHDTCPTMRQYLCTAPSCRHHSASANPSASARTSVPSDHPPSSGPAGSL